MDEARSIPIPPIINTTLSNFGIAIKNMPVKLVHKRQPKEQNDEFTNTGSAPLPPEARFETAAKKFNNSNELRIVAETNYFAELYHDYNLLQEYNAYKNSVLDGLEFTPVSEDTVSALYKGKQVGIKCKVLEDGNKQNEINFEDGSQISYISYFQGGKINIYGEEFEVPIGTILETRSVNGRVFSKLIQTPNMQKNVVNIPEVIEQAEQVLNTYNASMLS